MGNEKTSMRPVRFVPWEYNASTRIVRTSCTTSTEWNLHPLNELLQSIKITIVQSWTPVRYVFVKCAVKTPWRYPASILQSYLRDIIDICRRSTSSGLTSVLSMNLSALEERGEYSLLEINAECIPFKMRFARFREVKELNSHKEERQKLRKFQCTDSRQGLFHQWEFCQRLWRTAKYTTSTGLRGNFYSFKGY